MTPEVGLAVLGAAVVGTALGELGLTVGPAVVGAPGESQRHAVATL